jgi:hypothetical protein
MASMSRHHANRLANQRTARVDRNRSGQLCRVPGAPLERVPRALELTRGFSEGLALLAHHALRRTRNPAREDVRGAIQKLRPLRRARTRPGVALPDGSGERPIEIDRAGDRNRCGDLFR